MVIGPGHVNEPKPFVSPTAACSSKEKARFSSKPAVLEFLQELGRPLTHQNQGFLQNFPGFIILTFSGGDQSRNMGLFPDKTHH